MTLFKLTTLGLTAALGLVGHCQSDPASDEVWVANRIDGTISIVDTSSNEVIETIDMPRSGEPMYVNHSETAGVVFVGDRANNTVVAFDVDTRMPVASIPVGSGVFHQWTLPEGNQLWVNNDISLTTSVIDVESKEVIATIAMPRDLLDMEGVDGAPPKPHDVLISPEGDAAFVSYIGFAGDNDFIVRFDARTFEETARAAVGKDVHLSATAMNDLLYAPCQNSDAVYVLDRHSLRVMNRVHIPGAHGAGMGNVSSTFYVTNLPAEGDMGLFAMDTNTNSVLGDGVDAPMVGVPHNIALNADDSKVYVTHSGGDANLLSVYDVSPDHPLPEGASAEVIVGLNPFGLGFVDR